MLKVIAHRLETGAGSLSLTVSGMTLLLLTSASHRTGNLNPGPGWRAECVQWRRLHSSPIKELCPSLPSHLGYVPAILYHLADPPPSLPIWSLLRSDTALPGPQSALRIGM